MMKKIIKRDYGDGQVFWEYDSILYSDEEAALRAQKAEYGEDDGTNPFKTFLKKNQANDERVAKERSKHNKSIARGLGKKK